MFLKCTCWHEFKIAAINTGNENCLPMIGKQFSLPVLMAAILN